MVRQVGIVISISKYLLKDITFLSQAEACLSPILPPYDYQVFVAVLVFQKFTIVCSFNIKLAHHSIPCSSLAVLNKSSRLWKLNSMGT